jgi:hypothetical protein
LRDHCYNKVRIRIAVLRVRVMEESKPNQNQPPFPFPRNASHSTRLSKGIIGIKEEGKK